eukprot:scaffold8165_cov515-Pinguiococcus_pyrenoidosus.AAC.1
MVPIRNKLGQEVKVFVEETKQRVSLKPGELSKLDLPINRSSVVVCVNALGFSGWTSWRTRLCRRVLQYGGTEGQLALDVVYDDAKDAVQVIPRQPLPDHMELLDLVVSGQESVVQWATMRSAKISEKPALYVTFRGTDNEVDAMIDVGYIPGNERDFEGLRIQGAMWNALNSRDPITAKLASMVEENLEALRSESLILVLCGHSLGGGYATEAA